MTTDYIKTPKNIQLIFDRCSKIHSRFEGEDFEIGLFMAIQHFEISSPIEQALYASLRTISHINYLDHCVDIVPQYKIDKYRSDFAISYKRLPSDDPKLVLVECDSQQFHERTEQERRYEKARDRYFASKGLFVFHYTGKEILDDPFSPAIEILQHLISKEDGDLSDCLENYED